MKIKSALVVVVLISSAPFMARAYSINATATVPVSSPTSFDSTGSWTQLSAPFQNFFTNLNNVSPSDLPNEIVHPSTQLQSMIPPNLNGNTVVTDIFNFLTVTTGWLIGLSDKFAGWVISLIK